MLSMRGPCNGTDISKQSISIEVKCSCPIGFEIMKECVCVCDRVLKPYNKTECNITTKSTIRRDEFWIITLTQVQWRRQKILVSPTTVGWCSARAKFLATPPFSRAARAYVNICVYEARIIRAPIKLTEKQKF